MSKGFLTIAYGQYYHEIAENLVLSYIHSAPEKRLPFAVVAECESPHLQWFDQIIIVPPAEKGFMNKMKIEELSPFSETVFIDADCLVYSDISHFFDEYARNGSAFSSFGRNIKPENRAEINNILFDYAKAYPVWKNITTIPHFNAATYYCKSGGVFAKQP